MGCGLSTKYRVPEYHIDTEETGGWLECICTVSRQTLLPDVRNKRARSERLEEPILGLSSIYAAAAKRTELEVLIHGLPRWANARAECGATSKPLFEVDVSESEGDIVDTLAAEYVTETRAPPEASDFGGGAARRVHYCVSLGGYSVQKPYYDGGYPEVMRFVDGDGCVALTLFAYGEEARERRTMHAFAGDIKSAHDAASSTKQCVGILEEATGKLALRGALGEPCVRLALAALLLRRLRLQWSVVLDADIV